MGRVARAAMSDHTFVPSPVNQSHQTHEMLYYLMHTVGSPAALEACLNKGADVNILDDETGRTLLMGAAIWGYVWALQLLINSKASVDIKDKNGKTALDHAQRFAKTGTPDCGKEVYTKCAELLIAAALERDLIRVAQN